MKKFVFALAWVVSPLLAAAQEIAKPPVASNSKVIAVTVYRDTALVTREVNVAAGQGLVEIVVSPLPAQTIDSSLYSEGADGFRILSTRFRVRAVKDDSRDDVRAMEMSIKKLQADALRINQELQVAMENARFVAKLENFTATTMTSLSEKGFLNGETVILLSKYILNARGENAKSQVDLQLAHSNNNESIQFAQRKLAEAGAVANRAERDAVITVDRAAANNAGKITLNYLVNNATWTPQYKLRAATEKDPVQLEYLASISQVSGEDWNDAVVHLSTAQPQLNAAPPDLLGLQISAAGKVSPGRPATQPTLGRANYDYSQQLRKEASQNFNNNRIQYAEGVINQAAAIEQTDELLNPMAVDVNKELAAIPAGPRDGPSVTFHLKSKMTIPSRSDEQLIEVARLELQGDYFFKAVPVLTPHVYKLANLTNKSDYVLLPGEATMYVGKDFVGRMTLPLVAIGEQFIAGFGVDPQLQVTRTLANKTRTVQGANQVYVYDYRIRISSYKTAPAKLQLWDRVPKADAESVGVSLVKTTPDLSNDVTYVRDQKVENLLRWDLAIEPGTAGEKAKEVSYQFKLEYAKDVAIGDFKPQQKK